MTDISTLPGDFEKGTIPALRVIEPAPVKQAEFSYADQSLVPPTSPPSSSYRVVYRGSLSFSSAELDVPLEGTSKPDN
jgi:hypothetical protein